MLGALADPSSAQTRSATPARQEPDAFINQQRAVEERLRKQFDEEIGDSRRALFDWGGWYNTYLFVFDDGVESSRILRRFDLRLWGRLSLDQGAHQFYARGRFGFLDFNTGDSYDSNDDDVEGPNLERGFYRFDLSRALRAYREQTADYNVVVTAGRDLVMTGNGLALATPLDHLAVSGSYRSWELTLFGGRTVGSSQDFDLSRTATRMRRDVYGGELRYHGFDRHEPFVYAFRQHDRNREAIYQPFQKYDYDSFYVGAGSTGELWEHVRYSTEWVYESGSSFGHRQFIFDNDVEAWAVQAELEYLFPGVHKARASIEYLFGSGDSDRFASPTNSYGGNSGDRDDSGFIALGYRDTGLSFAPRYSNLHLWRTGASCHPWPDSQTFRHLELGADAYLFWKHHRDGAVSDPTANVRSGYLGWEMDYYLNWQVRADLSWTVRLGTFFPGQAYSDRSVRTFLLVGMTWSF